MKLLSTLLRQIRESIFFLQNSIHPAFKDFHNFSLSSGSDYLERNMGSL